MSQERYQGPGIHSTTVASAFATLVVVALATCSWSKEDGTSAKEADFLIVEHSPKDVWIDLPGELPGGFTEKRMLVRVATAGKMTWLLPVYVLKKLQLPAPGGTDAKVVLTFYDAIYHSELSIALQKAMDKQFGKGAWEAGKPIGNEVRVALWIDVNGQPEEVAATRFTRYPGRPEPTVQLVVDRSAAALLARADPKNLGLTFTETYRGRFKTVDLTAAVASSSATAIAFQNKLGTDTRGQRATLLVAFGGGVDQKVAVQQLFRRQVALEVLTREGKELNPALLESVTGKLFTGLQDEIKLKELKDDQVVTFLWANGLKATASIGTFKGLKSQWKKETDSLREDETARAWKERQKRAGEAGGWGVTAKLEMEDEREESSMDRFKRQFRAMDEAMKAIEGELPVAALNAKQVQTLSSRAETGLKMDLGTFTVGRKTLSHRLALHASFVQALRERDLPRQNAIVARRALRDAEARRERAKGTVSDLSAVVQRTRNARRRAESRSAAAFAAWKVASDAWKNAQAAHETALNKPIKDYHGGGEGFFDERYHNAVRAKAAWDKHTRQGAAEAAEASHNAEAAFRAADQMRGAAKLKLAHAESVLAAACRVVEQAEEAVVRLSDALEDAQRKVDALK